MKQSTLNFKVSGTRNPPKIRKIEPTYQIGENMIICTPGGDKSINELKLGDFVYNDSGKSVEISYIHKISNYPSVKVNLKNQEEFIFGELHECHLLKTKNKKGKSYRIDGKICSERAFIRSTSFIDEFIESSIILPADVIFIVIIAITRENNVYTLPMTYHKREEKMEWIYDYFQSRNDIQIRKIDQDFVFLKNNVTYDPLMFNITNLQDIKYSGKTNIL